MTSREKVQQVLSHKPVDGIALDFGATPVTGIHVHCVDALRKHYGLTSGPVKVHEPYQMLGLIEADLQDALGVDVEGVHAPNTMFGFPVDNWKPWTTPQGLDVLVPGDFNTTIDANGDILMHPLGDTSAPACARMPKASYFFDAVIRQDPVDDAKLNPEDNLEEFGPITDNTLEYYRKECELAVETGRAVIANFGGTALGDIALVPGLNLLHPKGIRDISEWYISTLTRPDYVHAIFTRQVEIALENLAKIQAVVGNTVDAVFLCGTDFGTQASTFCSKDTFHTLWLPYYQQINNWIHDNTTWKTFKHSCGAVETFLDSFIEAGFDIINPVQCTAAGMEAQHLKDTYGDRLTFWGGGIDTQTVLAFGTPDEVREQTLRRCEIFGKDGGFVYNSIHNIQANTPIDNLIALCDTIKSVNGN